MSLKASIVVPAYNEENVISETLRHLLAQDYPNFEIIVVNNASKDRTHEVAASFPGVRVVDESRKGLLWAREAGRQAATGDIIVNIDADCLPEKDWLSHGISYFENPKYVAVSGPYDYFDGGFFFRNTSLLLQKNVYWFVSKIVQLPFIKQGAILIGGNNFIRAEALKKAGGYDTSITFYGEDTNTAKRVSKFGYVLFNRSVVMKTSARRFIEEGKINITVKYLFHFFRTLLFG
jgi:cellulose synthase/poly-beta-1,6-N-acetylglucosamine synthase-like glycosyltransferase